MLPRQIGSGGASLGATWSPALSGALTILESDKRTEAQEPKALKFRNQFTSNGVGPEDWQTSPDIVVSDSH